MGRRQYAEQWAFSMLDDEPHGGRCRNGDIRLRRWEWGEDSFASPYTGCRRLIRAPLPSDGLSAESC